ncbi:MAG: inorganic diphosphatase [Myxococcota bacterium]
MTGSRVTVVIDVPRGSFVKRGDDGSVDFIYPLPCPFNYGHIPGTVAEDGDADDAVVLGKRLPQGSRTESIPWARIHFVDAGKNDFKWICASAPLSRLDRLQVASFFRVYAAAKRAINRIRGKRGVTRYLGWL